MTSVLIDGYALSDASEQRGIGTYLKRLVSGLQAESDLSVAVLAMGQRMPARLRDLEHDLLLPFELRRKSAEVFWSPAQHPPRRSPLPWLQTLHDLTPLSWPHPLLAADRRRWLRRGPRLRGAAAVVAVSRFSANEGIQRLGLDPARITVIPLGVDHDVFKPGDSQPVEKPYLLHVASWGPHKGFQEALAVAVHLADLGFPHRLVMAGPNDDWQRSQIAAAVRASGRPDRAELAGYVEDLAGLYRGAAALLMTSRCEGFGLPVLEAMASGTPVVSFDNSALPEVVGDGGVLVEDGNTQAMAAAVRKVLVDAPARDELVERGLAHAARFRWQDTTRAHADLLRSIAR